MNAVPALQLPFELISKIFLLCLPSHRRVRPRRHRAPLNLAGVCAQWRAVALRTRELWAGIFLQFSDGDKRPYHHLLLHLDTRSSAFVPDDHPISALVDLWCTRASDLPLSISLYCSEENYLPVSVFTIMANYSHRWSRIELVLPEADILFFHELSGPYPLLSTLHIGLSTAGRRIVAPRLPSLDYRVRYPNLKTLQDLGHSTFPADLKRFPKKLTVLRFVYAGLPTFVVTGGLFARIFRSLPHLLHLDIHAIHPSQCGPETSKSRVSLVTLRVNHEFLLGFLHAPSLRHLHVKLRDSRNGLYEFLYHSQPNLTTLSLELDDDPNSDALFVALPLVPQLATLIVSVPTCCLLDAVDRCEPIRDPFVVPRLQNLILRDNGRDPSALYTSWVDLLESRKSLAHAELWLLAPTIRADISRPSSEVEAQLEALEMGGMSTRIITKTYMRPEGAKDLDPIADLDIGLSTEHEFLPRNFSRF
ncbi:hypothetical protein R3P38DRAFT_2911216 [Favolaschia claudopus]|uniref:F-box domain-containing protein n=1 Tax=Favolaschia claudopus TaxID=2862362 RepID=A0AAW0CDU3_9AGAR